MLKMHSFWTSQPCEAWWALQWLVWVEAEPSLAHLWAGIGAGSLGILGTLAQSQVGARQVLGRGAGWWSPQAGGSWGSTGNMPCTSGGDTWIPPPAANGLAGVSTWKGLGALLWTQGALGWRGNSCSLGCCSTFTGGFPCWPALVTPRLAPVGIGHSYLTSQQWDDVQQSHGLPHCRTCVRQGFSLAHSAPCAGQQRRDLAS